MSRALPVFRWSDAPPDAVIMDIQDGDVAVAYLEETGRLYVLDSMRETEAASSHGVDFFSNFGPSPQAHPTSQSRGIIFYLTIIVGVTAAGSFLAIVALDAVGRFLR